MNRPTPGPGETQLAALRHQVILDTLLAHGQVSANALAEQLGVTHETVRKDLLFLQDRGLLRRVHGGAVPAESVAYEPHVGARTTYAAEKSRIALAAKQFIPDRGAVLIDSGSTTAALADAFPQRPNVIAVTNSLPIAMAMLAKAGTVATLGGRLRPETSATVDEWALQHLGSIRADVAFLGTNAFSIEHGLATPDQSEAAVKAGFVRSAHLRVLLADHSKFGRESVFHYAALTDIDVLVTDDGLTEQAAAELESRCGLEVIRA
ncbi:MAG TPA: DeoR/GlpR family DNA-binding transcription regulator [Intrasporangium sp.]|uniref:DeoR/GlpR family DNA-binding transcription regulator n=1 Tax=Intrasporangium sp. TaxID=1925024 RepID=UPI002D7769C8|nr:DeoR/GlpR family DNA-binding transcription regulator [Intrasporangium sp.]HET7397340.1 DeoR/GlpR family DNA-binding transcription regulator [Intrasporangium sp.]